MWSTAIPVMAACSQSRPSTVALSSEDHATTPLPPFHRSPSSTTWMSVRAQETRVQNRRNQNKQKKKKMRTRARKLASHSTVFLSNRYITCRCTNETIHSAPTMRKYTTAAIYSVIPASQPCQIFTQCESWSRAHANVVNNGWKKFPHIQDSETTLTLTLNPNPRHTDNPLARGDA